MKLRLALMLVVITPAIWAGCFGPGSEISVAPPEPGDFRGRLLTMDGQVVDGVVEVDGQRVETQSGRFAVDLPNGTGWLRASAPGFQDRWSAIATGEHIIRMMRAGVHLSFGGDVMLARRFQDSDWPPSPGLDGPLAGILPWTLHADVAIVNLETTLGEGLPLRDDKAYTFESPPALADALRAAGIDAVSLANNHVRDAGDLGLNTTLTVLDAAGIGHAGAGDDPWTPWATEVDGVRIAMLACTLVGAAPRVADCEDVQEAVQRNSAVYDIVVVQVHGGEAYNPKPSRELAAVSQQAHSAGADLVVAHHAHVPSGLSLRSGQLTAWGLGNLVFDSYLPATWSNVVLQVIVDDMGIQAAWLEPVFLDEGLPVPLVGRAAQVQARALFPWSHGAVVEGGSLYADLRGDRTAAAWTEAMPAGIHPVDAPLGAPILGAGARDRLVVGAMEGVVHASAGSVPAGAWIGQAFLGDVATIAESFGPRFRHDLGSASKIDVLATADGVRATMRWYEAPEGPGAAEVPIDGVITVPPGVCCGRLTWNGIGTLDDAVLLPWQSAWPDEGWTHIRLDSAQPVTFIEHRLPGSL